MVRRTLVLVKMLQSSQVEGIRPRARQAVILWSQGLRQLLAATK